MSQIATHTAVKVGIGLGIGYALMRGNPLIKRPIYSKGPTDVNDTRGKPIMDTKWSYKSRDTSTKTLDLTCSPAKPLSKNASQESTNETNFDVLIIGGAAAGLSCAACCEKEGLSYLVIEKNENVGDVWLSRYHRLHLHDIIDNCHLPYIDMPTTYPVFPSRKEFATYLEEYKRTLDLNVQTCSIVKHAARINKNDIHSGWIVTVQNNTKNNEIKKLKCKHLVMACGVYGDPKILKIPGSDQFNGLIVHSSRYTNGTDLGLKDKKVLVVGWGNSGSEICLDLLEHGAKPTLLIRSGQVVVPHTIMRKVESIPLTHLRYLMKIPFGYLLLLPLIFQDIVLKIICRLYYGDLSKYGIIVHKKGLVARFLNDGIAPLMDVGTIASIKDGSINVINSEVCKCNEDSVTFKNGVTELYDAIVLATGYQVFTSHRHWLDEDDQKLIGLGKDALDENKMLPGSNFKKKLPTLWYCFGNLLMINIAARIQTARIRGLIKKDNKNKIAIRKFVLKQILKHIIALIVIRKLWLWRKSK